MKRNNDQVSLSQKSELSKLESKSFHGTHPPARLGEVLLQLLGDRGVDVPLALLARDPAVLKGIATKKKKTLTTNICISCCSHICFFARGHLLRRRKNIRNQHLHVLFSVHVFVFCSRAFLPSKEL